MKPSSAPPIIVLFGLRGSGKTTLGRILSLRLGCPFTDLDERVRAGLGISDLASAIRHAGEPAFRDREAAELETYLATTTGPAVLALGGGTPTHPASRAMLDAARTAGRIVPVLLEATPPVLGARVAAAPGDRALLVGAHFTEEAEILSDRRLPGYRQLARFIVRTDQPAETAIEEILAFTRL